MRTPGARCARSIAVAVAAGVAFAAPAAAYHEPEEYFRFRDDQIKESSGVAASSKRDGLFFTHNDSGDTARFFAVDDHGCTLAVFDLADTSVVADDWEDMARGPGAQGKPSLWFADIGDNAVRRPTVHVYRVVEPRVAAGASNPDPAAECAPARARNVRADAFELAYEDGPHDAETLLVHPKSGRLYIVSKVGEGDAALYEAPRRLRPKRTNVLRKVAVVPLQSVTSGDIDPDGSRLVLRNYTDAYEFRIPGDDVAAAFAAPPRRIPLPATPQGEAIAYTRDSGALVTTSEGAGSTVFLLPDHP